MNYHRLPPFFLLFAAFISAAFAPATPLNAKPNVIVVITDDQGYGDVSAHGNPLLKTPNLDRLHAESVRLTNYHVDPTCSPTRSALMSGRYSTQTGVWHTICGRSMLDPNELTLAETFKANGYRTAMFGKWHLGDAHPLRPQDQGFDVAVHHGGGGVGQTPDYWGNDYFDDTYWRNGVPEKFEGYCTDVWFQEASSFIRKNKDQPFFTYISTNAPHGPFLVDEKYAQPYRSAGAATSRFLGMIANIDENLGKLMKLLAELELEDDTILIFTTDNGTAAGGGVFNAGMRGKKGSAYDGGHRVPFFLRWPKGGLNMGTDVDQLTAHIDVRPTLAELCELKEPDGPKGEGTSLATVMKGDKNGLRDRTLFVHSQRILQTKKWKTCSVMTDQWRLINGEELYDIRKDPGQETDLASENKDVVQQLRKAYEGWWQKLEEPMKKTVHMTIGSKYEPRVRLTAHDWLRNGGTPWNQGMIRRGPVQNGPWALAVAESGKYEIVVSRWPEHIHRSMKATSAKITIQGNEVTKQIKADDTSVAFEVNLQKSDSTRLKTFLTIEDGERGAYYAYIKRTD